MMRIRPMNRRERAVTGEVRVGTSTKQLVRRVAPKHIIVIRHRDIDEMAATAIIAAKVKAVINAEPSMTGRYPITGAKLLLDAGIPIVDIDPNDFERFADGMEVTIQNGGIRTKDGGFLAACRPFTMDDWVRLSAEAERNLGRQLNDFIDNTLQYAGREKEFVIRPLPLPPLSTPIEGRHVLIVVRGVGYKEDLQAIREYIEDYRPVLIGVDGGADALLECGFRPHMIVGDMDSVTDEALLSGAEIVVHAYPDGTAPGLARARSVGLERVHLVPAPGTSEDIAMLIAYERQAELIVTLGAHSHMIDFLQKGRPGMASTMLVRMKIGAKLIDAKGVSKLYNRPPKLRQLWILPAAALFPLGMLGLIHPGFRRVADLLWLYVKLSMS